MNLFTITTPGGENIDIVPATEERFQDRILHFADAFNTSGDFGEMLFQYVGFQSSSLWYSYYQMNYEMVFCGEVKDPVVEAHITLKDSYVQSLGRKKENIYEAGQFNLTAAPYMKNKVLFPEGGEYISFDIHPSEKLLWNLAQDFPELDQFLNILSGNPQEAMSLYHTPLFISPSMNHLIFKILTLLKSPAPKKTYIEILINELLILLLMRGETIKRPRWKLKKQDIDALHEARKLIIQEGQIYDFEDLYDTSTQLAERTGLSLYKFKRGFRQLFDVSPYHLLQEVRLYRARQLLKDTHYSILDIALKTGYHSPEGFSKAYKKLFKISPSDERK